MNDVYGIHLEMNEDEWTVLAARLRQDGVADYATFIEARIEAVKADRRGYAALRDRQEAYDARLGEIEYPNNLS